MNDKQIEVLAKAIEDIVDAADEYKESPSLSRSPKSSSSWLGFAEDARKILSKLEGLNIWLPIDTAPRDGTRIRLYRESGRIMIGRWGIKEVALLKEMGHHDCKKESWLSDDEKFIDVPIDPVISWSLL